MEQISLPMRIALAAVLAFAAMWFVALRPKPAPSTAASDPVPAVTKAPEKAQNAVDAANKTSAGRERAAESAATQDAAATPSAAATAAPATASKPSSSSAAAGKPAAPSDETPRAARNVLADLDAGRSVVLLFWNGKTSDDRSVRRAVASIDRHDGKVAVHVASIGKVGDYETITRDVPVTTTPTVLVLDRNRQARKIEGLTVKSEIDETVDRALRAGR